MLNKYVGELIWMVSQDLENQVYFFPNRRIKIKMAKRFAYF